MLKVLGGEKIVHTLVYPIHYFKLMSIVYPIEKRRHFIDRFVNFCVVVYLRFDSSDEGCHASRCTARESCYTSKLNGALMMMLISVRADTTVEDDRAAVGVPRLTTE